MAGKKYPPVTVERLEEALQVIATLIVEHGRDDYIPIMERLEKELANYKEARDPVSRARAILKRQAAKE
jgi:hypothetical protein